MSTDDYFALLVTPGATATVLELPEQTRAATAAEVVEQLFAVEASLNEVTLRVGCREYGIVTRARLAELRGHTPRQVGDGDHGRLPGPGTFVLLRFSCTACGKEELRVHVDEGRLPRCSEHGEMRRET
ncbi:hypothetical protein [Streptomyces melanogenes]|uniref:hypothetical protein n=1 Tax=Streptomyces melanogenes TaxID=67326 RepID=UPI00167D1D18|nr:hypothetical protein [Streptomyces melanogenes]GGP82689.1 hypothetical protein GCM10010278_71690 [Streptomyces melanogenes]